MKFTRILSLAAAGILAVGLVACNSDSEPDGGHDHSAHGSDAGDKAADEGDGHGDHDGAGHGDHANAGGHDMAAMGDAAAMPGLKKIEPSADYPMKTCVVSGEELGGSMGDAMAYDFNGQEVQFCCEGCIEEFKASPEKFVAKVKAAAAK